MWFIPDLHEQISYAFIVIIVKLARRIRLMPEVKSRRGESIDKALRRLKKKLDKEGTLREVRNRREYEKPSELKRQRRR